MSDNITKHVDRAAIRERALNGVRYPQARQDILDLLEELESADNKASAELISGRYWSQRSHTHERAATETARELRQAREHADQLASELARADGRVSAALAVLADRHRHLPQRQTDAAHGAMEVIEVVRSVLTGAAPAPAPQAPERTRADVLGDTVDHLMRLRGYAPSEYDGEPDHFACDVQGHTEFGPILDHHDEDGRSRHPTHDERDELAALLVEGYDEVIAPWIGDLLDAERERIARSLDAAKDALVAGPTPASSPLEHEARVAAFTDATHIVRASRPPTQL